QVPNKLDDLVKLPGVGRKTANVVLGVIWNTPEGVVVDTHVQRLAQRLGWTRNTEPPEIEEDLMQLIPQDRWAISSHLLIFHGRRVCFAQRPNCEGCLLNDTCPSAFKAENVGRKPKRVRPAMTDSEGEATGEKAKKPTRKPKAQSASKPTRARKPARAG